MLRKLTLSAVIAATAVLAIAPAALAAAPKPKPKPPVVTVEPINDYNVHWEFDGTVVQTWTVGTRKFVSYASGRLDVTETYTMDQTATKGETQVYDSSALITSRHVSQGNFTILYSVTAHTDMLWGDGRDCDIDTRMLVARNKMIVNEVIGPVCTAP
jgi:hypothetical protein